VLLPVLDIFYQLPTVATSHACARVPHPVVDEDLSSVAALQHCFPEPPEHMKAGPELSLAKFLENWSKVVSRNISSIQQRSVRCAEQIAAPTIANEPAQNRRSIGVQIHVSASRFGFEMLFDVIPVLRPLLTDIDHGTVRI